MKNCKNYVRDGKEIDGRTAGREETVGSLLLRHEERARKFAYRLSRNLNEAEELVQQAGYKVLRDWTSYDPMRSFQTWYLAIVKNLYKDARRRLSRWHVVPLDARMGLDEGSFLDALPDPTTGLVEDLERREMAKAVRTSLLALKEGYRAVLTLCDMEGMPYKDAARKLGLPTGTVRSRLSRARAEFKRKIEVERFI